MYPLNDNDLDRLSRDAAEQYDVDQNASTSGWEALETRLNKELPLEDEKKRRRFLFWLFFIVLLAGGSLWWMMSGDNTDAAGVSHVASAPAIVNDGKNSTSSDNTVSPDQGIVQDDSKTIIDKQPAPQPAGTPAAQVPAANPQNTGDQSKNSPLTENKAINPGTGKEANVAGNDKVSAKSAKDKNGKETKTIVPLSPSSKKVRQTGALVLADNGLSGKTTGKNLPPLKKKGNKPTGVEKVPAGNDKDDVGVVIGNVHDAKAITPVTADKNVPVTATVPADDKAADTAAIKAPVAEPKAALKDTTATAQKPAADKKNNKKVRGFEIGIIGGPDKSNVKFTHSADVGYNIGLQLGYRFSNRWSVNTGLLYTKKNYKADGKDVAKYGWYANPAVDVYAMEGYCSMLDIPLNVRYDFSVTPKNRFFASTGLSTYIMKNEDYDYYWKYGGTNGTSNWTTNKGGAGDSTYLFSILNLSAGFEHSLNKHFSIQAEPYLKLPLSQLGHAKLNLNSYGIYFSFKYRIAK